MKKVIRIFIGVVIGLLIYRCFLKEQINGNLRNTIEHRHNMIDSLFHKIDSLYDHFLIEIDSLSHEVDKLQGLYDRNDYPDFVQPISSSEMIAALIQVESEGNDSAYCVREDAVGCLQIRPIMVNEVNRILKIKKETIRYTLQDRWNRGKSVEMFYVWKNFHHSNSNFEKIARNWNGGPQGINISATAHYWKKVKNEINS